MRFAHTRAVIASAARLGLFFAVSSAGACAVQAGESGPLEEEPGVLEDLEGKLSSNGLLLNQAAVDKLVTAPLALTQSEGEPGLRLNEGDFAPLLQAPGGPELLSYIATCALDEGQELRVESSDQVFTGNLGLAPQWANESCDKSCQRWISACLLAHSNATGNPVTISVRGSNPGLLWTQEIESSYTYQEAAYYGNVFAPFEQRVLQACAGESLFAGVGEENRLREALDQGAEFLAGRICGVGACGFKFAGACQDLSVSGVPQMPELEGVCSTYKDGYLANCVENDGFDPEGYEYRSSIVGDGYTEVVTVYLEL